VADDENPAKTDQITVRYMVNDIFEDADGDGIEDHIEGTGDRDNDGIPNYLDDDKSEDIPTLSEWGMIIMSILLAAAALIFLSITGA